jgi:hypothetical protein
VEVPATIADEGTPPNQQTNAVAPSNPSPDTNTDVPPVTKPEEGVATEARHGRVKENGTPFVSPA